MTDSNLAFSLVMIRPIVTHVALPVGLSVSVGYERVPCKTAEPIEMSCSRGSQQTTMQTTLLSSRDRHRRL